MRPPISQSNKSAIVLATALAIVTFGLAIRTIVFRRNYSLMLDECAISLDTLQGNLSCFVHTLPRDQAAPLGFLLLQKSIFNSFGMNDYTTRIIPFCFGAIALVAALMLASTVFDRARVPAAFLVAIGLISINRGAIQYAATAKQYSLEVAVTILMLLALAASLNTGTSTRRQRIATVLLVLSPILVWFSFGAVFVIVAIGVVLCLRAFRQGVPGDLRTATLFTLNAIIQVTLFYFLSMRPASANNKLAAMWASAYMPLWPLNQTAAWLYTSFHSVGGELIHLRMADVVPISIILVAGVAVWKRSWFALALLLPIALCLGASAVRLYPFTNRLLLFLMPCFVFIVALAVELVERRSRIVGALLGAVILTVSGFASIRYGVLRYEGVDDVRSVQSGLINNMHSDDQLWVAPLASRCFEYYSMQMPPPAGAIVHLLNDSDAASLTSGRNWILVMRTPWAPGEGEVLLGEGAAAGTEIISFDRQWTTARLFEINSPHGAAK
jgi:hypothetical protein